MKRMIFFKEKDLSGKRIVRNTKELSLKILKDVKIGMTLAGEITVFKITFIQ